MNNTFGIACAYLIPLTTYSLIVNTNSFWTAIFARILFLEKLKNVEILGLILGYIGVFMIVYNHDTEPTKALKNMFILGIFLSIIVSITMASVQIMNRKMKDIHHGVI